MPTLTKLDRAIINNDNKKCRTLWNNGERENSVAWEKFEEIASREFQLQDVDMALFLVDINSDILVPLWNGAFAVTDFIKAFIDKSSENIIASFNGIKDINGWNVLDHALFKNQLEIANSLVNKGFVSHLDFNVLMGINKNTYPLIDAIKNNKSIEEVEKVLKNFDVNSTNSKGHTLLMQAAFWANDSYYLQSIMHAGVNIWDQCHKGYTALVYAAYKGNGNNVEYLYDCMLYNRDLSRNDEAEYKKLDEMIKSQLTLALEQALFAGHFEVWKNLFENCNAGTENINRFDRHGLRPLVIVVGKKDGFLVSKMIKAGANVNFANNQNADYDRMQTPLMCAVNNKDTEMMELLVKAGANVHPHVVNYHSDSIYQLAEKAGKNIEVFLLNLVTAQGGYFVNRKRDMLESDKKATEPGQVLRSQEPGWSRQELPPLPQFEPQPTDSLPKSCFWVGHARHERKKREEQMLGEKQIGKDGLRKSASTQSLASLTEEKRPDTPRPGRRNPS